MKADKFYKHRERGQYMEEKVYDETGEVYEVRSNDKTEGFLVPLDFDLLISFYSTFSCPLARCLGKESAPAYAQDGQLQFLRCCCTTLFLLPYTNIVRVFSLCFFCFGMVYRTQSATGKMV